MDADDGFNKVQGEKKTAKEETNDKYGGAAQDFSMDPARFGKGIDMDRKCQDILMLIVFFAFLGAMGFCTVYGNKHGNVGKLLAPLDGDGNFCGYTAGFEDYPKLYITEFTALNPVDIFETAVCVKKCPMKGDKTIDGKTSSYVKDLTDSDIIDEVYNTKEVMKYCFPASSKDLSPEFKEGWKLAKASFFQSSIGQYFHDLYLSSRAIYASMVMGCVYCFAYIYLMSAFAECISWVCIVFTQIGLFGASIMCWMMRQDSINNRTAAHKGDVSQASTGTTAAEKQEKYLLAGTIIVGILALAFCTCVICGYKSLKVAIDVIDASADFLAGTKRILFVPMLYFVLTLISVLVWSGAMACVASMNEIKADPLIPQAKDLVWKENVTYMGLFMLFGILWLTAWFEYTSTFIVMVSSATYYFDSNKDREGEATVALGFKFAYLYHAGSISCGALIIAIIRFIRIVFLYLAKKAEKASGGNVMVKVVVACGACILKCIEKICDYINKSAFAYMAISGDSFCSSAWNGFLLNVKHLLKFSFANYLAMVFTFLGKVAITVGNVFSLWGIMKFITEDTKEVSSLLGPVVLVAIVTYITASVFLGLFDVTVISLLTCYAVDMDMNGEAKFGPPTFHEKTGKLDDDELDKRTQATKVGNEMM